MPPQKKRNNADENIDEVIKTIKQKSSFTIDVHPWDLKIPKKSYHQRNNKVTIKQQHPKTNLHNNFDINFLDEDVSKRRVLRKKQSQEIS